MTTTIMIEIKPEHKNRFMTAFEDAIKTHWKGKMMCSTFADIDNEHLVYEFFGSCKRMKTRTNEHGMWQVLMKIADKLFWVNDDPCVLHYCDGENYIVEDGHVDASFTNDTIVRKYVDFYGLELETTADMGIYIPRCDMVG